MRFLKNKILWLTLYAIGVTCVFLFVLFPSKLVLQHIEQASASSEYALKAQSLRPALPLGLMFKELTVRSTLPPEDLLLQGQELDVQVSPLALVTKNKMVYVSGKAYSGTFDGSVGFFFAGRSVQPLEGKVTFKNIDLGRYSPQGPPVIKGMSGTARGSMVYSATEGAQNASGKLSVYLTRGGYPLPEPFLGISRIDFDRGEVQAQLKSNTVKVEKFEFYGAQVNCFLTGEIQLAGRMDQSQLNLKGTIEIVGKTKIKMNVTVSGTLASPSFRYI